MDTFEAIRARRTQMQNNILKGFNPELGDVIIEHSELEKAEAEIDMLFTKGEIAYDDELEKAVYADTAHNRKLGRVGQEYSHKKVSQSKMNAKIGRSVGYKSDPSEEYEITKVHDDGKIDLKGKKSGFKVLNVTKDRLKSDGTLSEKEMKEAKTRVIDGKTYEMNKYGNWVVKKK